MPVMTALDPNSPLMRDFKVWKESEDFANTKNWPMRDCKAHIEGALWNAFMVGFVLATERAANLHESVDPASDMERREKSPGAGAMGAVIEYRDIIRNSIDKGR